MSAQIIDGKAIAKKIRVQIRQEVEQLRARGVQPGLAAVLVGDNPSSVIYVRNKRKACEEVGIYSEEHRLPDQTREEDLLKLIEGLNSNPKIHGILIQLPLGTTSSAIPRLPEKRVSSVPKGASLTTATQSFSAGT